MAIKIWKRVRLLLVTIFISFVAMAFMGCTGFEAGNPTVGAADSNPDPGACLPATWDADKSQYKVDLAWDPVTTRSNGDPIDPNIDPVAYNVYYGVGSSNYDQVRDAGQLTNIRIGGLKPNIYYFSVKAYYVNNPTEESRGFSNEVCAVFPQSPTKNYLTVEEALDLAIAESTAESTADFGQK